MTEVVYGAGRQRVENERWVLFKSHYGFDAFCDARRISQRLRTIGQDFAVEQHLLSPLPAETFDPGLVLTPRVDRSSLVIVRSMKCSVPARFINRKVRVSLQATQVRIFDGRTLIATHLWDGAGNVCSWITILKYSG